MACSNSNVPRRTAYSSVRMVSLPLTITVAALLAISLANALVVVRRPIPSSSLGQRIGIAGRFAPVRPTPSANANANANANAASNANANGASNPWAAMAGMGGMQMPPGMGGMGGGMPQMPPGMNPDQMMAMLDNPMMQQMMQQMVDQNPDGIRQMLEAQNPMFRQMFQGNPEMANNMVRQMMNPQALRGMMQMQRAMGGGAGGMQNPMAMPGMMPGGTAAAPGGGASAAAAGGLDFSTLLGGGANPSSQSPPDFSGMMQQMQSMFGGSGAPAGPGAGLFGNPQMQQQQQQQQHPADRYRSQLNSLRDMGFDDEQQCLAVLQQNHGNLNRAVDALLMGPPIAAPAQTAIPAPLQAPSSSNNNNDSTSEQQEPLPDPKNAQHKKDD